MGKQIQKDWGGGGLMQPLLLKSIQCSPAAQGRAQAALILEQEICKGPFEP